MEQILQISSILPTFVEHFTLTLTFNIETHTLRKSFSRNIMYKNIYLKKVHSYYGKSLLLRCR
jgi:hypothetical protein